MGLIKVIAKVSLGPSQKVLSLPQKIKVACALLTVRPFLTRLPSSANFWSPPRPSEQGTRTIIVPYRLQPDLLAETNVYDTLTSHTQYGNSTRSWCWRCRSRFLRTPLRHRLCARTMLTSHRVALVLSHCADTRAVPTRWAKLSTRVDSRRR
jgi:hypothetical protein